MEIFFAFFDDVSVDRLFRFLDSCGDFEGFCVGVDLGIGTELVWKGKGVVFFDGSHSRLGFRDGFRHWWRGN